MGEINGQTTQNRDYKDVSLTFARNPVTDDVVAVLGADAVKRSIKNLLLTMTGEVPFFPEFGTNLYRLLFEPSDAITTALIESEIRATITAYEPRVTIRSLSVVPTDDELQYNIDMELQLVNLPQPITLTIFLSRIR